MVEAQQDMGFYQAASFFLGKLTMTDLKVYHAVGQLGHDTACKAYQHEIAAQANLNPRQVRRSLARLVSVGLLERSGGLELFTRGVVHMVNNSSTLFGRINKATLH